MLGFESLFRCQRKATIIRWSFFLSFVIVMGFEPPHTQDIACLRFGEVSRLCIPRSGILPCEEMRVWSSATSVIPTDKTPSGKLCTSCSKSNVSSPQANILAPPQFSANALQSPRFYAKVKNEFFKDLNLLTLRKEQDCPRYWHPALCILGINLFDFIFLCLSD